MLTSRHLKPLTHSLTFKQFIMKLFGLVLCLSLTALVSMKSISYPVNARTYSDIPAVEKGYQSYTFPKNFYQLPVRVFKLPASGYVKSTPECFSIVVTNPGTVTTHIVYRDCETGGGEYFIAPGDTISTVCMDFFGGVQVPEGDISIVSMTNCAL